MEKRKGHEGIQLTRCPEGRCVGRLALACVVLAWAGDGFGGLPTRNRQQGSGLQRKKICLACIFFLHAETAPVFCTCELASTQRRKRSSLRRTRVRIEFDICSRAVPFPSHSPHQEESCETDALASRCGHLLHGVRRNLWHRGNHSWRRLRT